MRLIDADALTEDAFEVQTREYGNVEVVSLDSVDSAVTCDAALVVHGRWESVCGCIVRCNSCGSEAARKSNYCPNCGARMDTEDKL